MAKRNFQKGTEEWQMLADFNRLQSDFWQVEDNDSYWNGLMTAISDFCSKYEEIDSVYSKSISLGFLDAQEEKLRVMKGIV